IEAAADAVLIGAGSLRATPGLHYAPHLKRIVLTQSGDVFYHEGKLRRFFSDAPELAFVACPDSIGLIGPIRPIIKTLPADPSDLLKSLRQDHNVKRLVIEGGSEINAIFLNANLVDELFLTLAPKIKLGRTTPTYAGGEPLARADVMGFTVVYCEQIADEVFLRYRRA
ncbi:MAG: dihydrofolate reductase family protein, partial [Fimbriimonadaceae bacterium]